MKAAPHKWVRTLFDLHAVARRASEVRMVLRAMSQVEHERSQPIVHGLPTTRIVRSRDREKRDAGRVRM
jgi:hypothetical protein